MPFLGTTPTQGFVSSFPKQSFTPDGSTTVFTLTNPVATANDLEVFVGNVRQEPTTALLLLVQLLLCLKRLQLV